MESKSKAPETAARVQISKQKFAELHTRQDTPGTIFNIWHLQESGGESRRSLASNTQSPGHWSAADIGYTAAPDDHARFCVWFARGLCVYGPECRNLHRIPARRDDPLMNPALDCFGREKHAAYRDDMAGVGSFMHENKSISVSNFDSSIKNVGTVVRHRFAPFGSIEDVVVSTNNRHVQITFKYEAQAQFAKEAMSFQPLMKGSKRGVIVKWAKPIDTSVQDIKRIQQALEARAQNI